MHTIARSARPTGGAAERLRTGPSWIGAILRRFLAWSERSRQRQALSGLDDAMLKDIGLSRADIEFEAAKPFWRE
jgi:uncharacterized protein YjiS (DUF1127 family)